jgi:hypothetical protein
MAEGERPGAAGVAVVELEESLDDGSEFNLCFFVAGRPTRDVFFAVAVGAVTGGAAEVDFPHDFVLETVLPGCFPASGIDTVDVATLWLPTALLTSSVSESLNTASEDPELESENNSPSPSSISSVSAT